MISEEIYNEIIRQRNEGISIAKISENLKISKYTVRRWCKKDKYNSGYWYKTPLKQDYDFSLLENLNDSDFSTKYNISTERARQFRQKYAPETKSKKIKSITNKEKNQKIDLHILEFITNNISPVNIKKFCIKYNHSNRIVTKERFLKIAKENNIEIIFIGQKIYDHGYDCTRKKCKCDIGRLASAIRARYERNKISLKASNWDYFANEFIEEYKIDGSRYHKNFYDMIDKKIVELNNSQLIANQSDFSII